MATPQNDSPPPTRSEVEDFLYEEALTLDEWRLDEWLELFEADATYHIPPTDDPDADPAESLFLIADSRSRIEARVKRLMSRNAHVENPRSRTRRLITNVIVRSSEVDDCVEVHASFTVWRIRREINDVYVGSYRHQISFGEGGLKFRSRKAILDLDALRPAGKVSIIL